MATGQTPPISTRTSTLARRARVAASYEGYMLVTLIFVCVWCVVSSIWELRRSIQKDILPRKYRLEALLKQLDAP